MLLVLESQSMMLPLHATFWYRRILALPTLGSGDNPQDLHDVEAQGEARAQLGLLLLARGIYHRHPRALRLLGPFLGVTAGENPAVLIETGFQLLQCSYAADPYRDWRHFALHGMTAEPRDYFTARSRAGRRLVLEGVAAITARGPLSASDPTCLWVQEHGPVLAEKVGILLSLPEVDVRLESVLLHGRQLSAQGQPQEALRHFIYGWSACPAFHGLQPSVKSNPA